MNLKILSLCMYWYCHVKAHNSALVSVSELVGEIVYRCITRVHLCEDETAGQLLAIGDGKFPIGASPFFQLPENMGTSVSTEYILVI